MREEIKASIEFAKTGEVPNGWKKEKIVDICNLSSGSTPSRKSKENFTGDILWVTSGELKGKYLLSTNEMINNQAVIDSGLKLYKSGTVIIAMYGLEADGIRGTCSISAKECTISQACMAFTDFKQMEPEYFYYWYKNNGNKIGLKYAQGTKQQNLCSDLVGKINIIFPPVCEQRKIIKYLATLDEIINKTYELICQKQKQKYWLMQNLLTGKKRLSGFHGNWKEKRLNEVVNVIEKRNAINNTNVLTISAQYGLISQKDFFKKEIASKNKENYYLLEKDDFAYNKSYSGDYTYGAVKRLKNYDSGIVSPLYICFRVTDKNISLDYLEYYFEFGMADREIANIAQEGARNHGLLNISTKDFFNIKLILPTYEEQKMIAEILVLADKEINLLEQKLDLIKQEKKAVMQLLLTGIVRVPQNKKGGF